MSGYLFSLVKSSKGIWLLLIGAYLVISIAIAAKHPPFGVLVLLVVPFMRNLYLVDLAQKKNHRPHCLLVAINGLVLLLTVLFII